MDWYKFRDWMTLGLLTVGVYIFGDLNKNVANLNLTMAAITERIHYHEKILNKHDLDIDRLKTKK